MTHVTVDKKGNTMNLKNNNLTRRSLIGGLALPVATAVLAAVKGSHRNCQTAYRAFTGKAGFEAFVGKNSGLLKDARPLSLDQMLVIAKGG